MRPSSCFWLAFCVILGLSACKGGAQTPAPAPDCNSALISLLPCLDYVQGNVSAPPQNCCVGLGSVVQSNPICLCLLFNSSALPIQVNTTRALQLPALCSVNTPNPSVCGGSVVAPVQEPVPSPPVSTPVPPVSTPVAAPTTTTTPPPAGTPPIAATTPPTAATTPPSTTPVLAPSAPATPSVAPSTPMTPSVTPSVAPVVAPSIAPSVAPVVSPSAPSSGPSSGVPAPTPMVATPVSSPTSTPATTPTAAVSSPPAPPPATSENYAAPMATASLLSVLITVSSILFLQL